MSLHFIVMGYKIYFHNIGWDFADNPAVNLARLQTSILSTLFGTADDGEFPCDLGSDIGVSTPRISRHRTSRSTPLPRP